MISCDFKFGFVRPMDGATCVIQRGNGRSQTAALSTLPFVSSLFDAELMVKRRERSSKSEGRDSTFTNRELFPTATVRASDSLPLLRHLKSVNDLLGNAP